MNLQKFEILILGCNSALPSHNRNPSAQVLNVHDQLYLIDCGEGTQTRLSEHKVKRTRINQIFISHLHGDHVFGLPGLLTSFSQLGRVDDLTIFGPRGLRLFVETILDLSDAHLSYTLHIEEIDTTVHKKIFEDQSVSVYSIPLDHRIPTSGYLFKEKLKQIDFSKEEIKQLTQEQLQKIAERQTRSYAYCSDTVYLESIIPIIRNVNVLYHETTYLQDLTEKAKETKHSTALQAAKIALAANAKLLITGHYSSRYKELEGFKNEAMEVFGNVVLGEEGSVIVVSH